VDNVNFEAIIIGCITGFLSAFFGIGGSSVDTPVLRTFLNLPPLLALGTPLPLPLQLPLLHTTESTWSISGSPSTALLQASRE
jgi:Sulfite exporter TauE/SafE.